MEQKVALVMGGGAGTGRATALAFSAAGACVVIVDIKEEGGRETLELVQAQGGEGLFVKANMGSADDIQRVLEQTRTQFGGLHMVSNNAALGTPNKPVTDLSEQEWDRCMGVTLKGVWLSMKYQLPLIEASGGGAIVNIASVSGIRGEAFQSAYAAAKGGVITLTKAVASEYARRGIRVNSICPGGINTGGMQFYLDQMPEMREKVLNTHAMGRLAEPEEIANAVVFLCSQKASFITGHDLVVDGGVMVKSNVIDFGSAD
ncbi:MAG: glucose 1-dehydrogenase [Halieaceae bacterium]|jgi:NAD(P)-dependent dehydrogenase (short-subunit alcohol dehydrogenase family)|nr:glucose 1-dehydrogenase [Halieaceae bacterium]